jgi:hypothetical protein
MKTFTVGDLTYLAGLIDGDGSIIAQNVRRKDYKNKFQIRLTVQISQRNKRQEHLEKIQRLIGAGTVQKYEKGMAQYQLIETSEVYNFLQQLLPYLRMKKKQAALVIRIIQQLPAAKASKEEFLKLAELADQVASYNDSKTRKVTADVVAKELADHDWIPG